MSNNLQEEKIRAEIDKLKAEKDKIEREKELDFHDLVSLFVNFIIIFYALYAGVNIMSLQGEVIKVREEKLRTLEQQLETAEEKNKQARQETIRLSNLIESKRAEVKRQPVTDTNKGTVFIQFRGTLKRDLMKNLSKFYRSKGYDAPGVERVPGDYNNEVRYFHPSDVQRAESVSEIAKDFFRTKQCPINQIELKELDINQFPNVPKKQVEIWIHHVCKTPS